MNAQDLGTRQSETSDLDVVALHARAVAATRRVLAGIRPDQWANRVETASTDVRTLTNHVVVETDWVAPLLAGESPDEVRQRFPYRTEAFAADPVADYDRASAAATAAFSEAGAMAARCEIGAPGVPAESRSGRELCGSRFVDVLVHGWEIAKATGQDASLDPDLAKAAYDVIEPEIRELFEHGVIRQPLDVPAGADPQTRLLALFGFSD